MGIGNKKNEIEFWILGSVFHCLSEAKMQGTSLYLGACDKSGVYRSF